MTEYGQLKLNMKDVRPGQRLYMGISGGLDSGYLAWRLLRDGYRLLLHHCTYKTGQNRWPKEEIAYQAILEWLVKQNLTNWELITTEFSRNKSIPYWFLDYEFLWWVAGAHLRDHPDNKDRQDIQHIIIPDHRESLSLGTTNLRRAYQTLNYVARRHITPVSPMSKYSRPQILADMPPELIELCWSCRRPNGDEPCHTCSACRVVDPALKIIGHPAYRADRKGHVTP